MKQNNEYTNSYNSSGTHESFAPLIFSKTEISENEGKVYA